MIAFVGSINYLLYNFVILYVIHNPKEILNGFLTGVGSGMKLLSYSLVIVGIRGIIVFYLIDNFILIIIAIFVIGLAARIVMEYDRQYILLFGKGLDYVQLKAVKIIKSINLVSVIEKDNKILKNKKKALELVQKMKESNDYGVMLEFSELIKKDRGSSLKWLWGFVSIVIIFVISSVGEGIVQDLLNDSVKAFLCKLFGILCEN